MVNCKVHQNIIIIFFFNQNIYIIVAPNQLKLQKIKFGVAPNLMKGRVGLRSLWGGKVIIAENPIFWLSNIFT